MRDIAVTVAAEEVAVAAGRAALTVSVTNGGPGAERLVLRAFPPAATPGAPPPADPGWVRVDRPLRDVGPGATEQYGVALEVPGEVPAGAYGLKLVAHPADAAPEEYADRGRLVTVVVPAAAVAPPPRRRPPWWVWAVAGALLVAVVVVAVVLLRPPATVAVPDVVGLAGAEAEAALTDAGLEPDVGQRLGARPFGTVTAQVPDPGTAVRPGSTVALVESRALPLDGLEGLSIENALALLAARVDADVTGLAVADAQTALADRLAVDVRYQVTGAPAGTVTAASAPDSPDGQVAAGERLLLVVATTFDLGALDDLVVIPDLEVLDPFLGG